METTGKLEQQTRTFSTMSQELLKLSDWLSSKGVTQVAMESTGKRLSGTTGSGNQWLRTGLVQAAQAAVRCKGTYLASVFRRLSSRRGRNKAIVAVAHRLLKAAYYILTKREPYQDLGANYLDHKGKEHLLTRLCRGIQQLGYQVSLQLPSPPTV